MNAYSRSHLSDDALVRDLISRASAERGATAELLASIAEVDERRLYVPAGHPSMFSYCVGVLGLSEDASAKRIQAARATRRFPTIFPALAEGRLHLTAVNLLVPYLTEATADGLLAAAERRTKAEIERLLAERFPRTEVLAWLAPATPQPALARVGTPEGRDPDVGAHSEPACDGTAEQHALAHVGGWCRPARAVPVSAHRPRRGPQDRSSDPRYIPADVKREVWERDGGQCSFVSTAGQRCPACKFLEFDHLEPVAVGGQPTAANIRLLCRAHNQQEAERAFGAGFMREKREQAQHAARARDRRMAEGNAAAIAAAPAHVVEVVPWLPGLGIRADEARAAAALCQDMQDAALERRVRVALSYFHRKRSTQALPMAT